MILMKYHTLFLSKIGKDISRNLSSAAVVIGPLRVKSFCMIFTGSGIDKSGL